MKLYVLTHKNFSILPNLPTCCTPLQVGSALYPALGFLRDDTGNNISLKNDLYNELTGMYWVWKNSCENIIGFCHYRRYFVTLPGKINNLLFGKMEHFLTEAMILKKLNRYDMIVHNRTFFHQGVYRQLIEHQGQVTVDMLEKAVAASGPIYINAFQQIMNRKSIHLLNMCITSKSVFDAYASWLFPVLFHTERLLCQNAMYTPPPRTMGMLAERLLDVWITANNIKIAECLTINTERIDWKVW